MTIQRLYPGSRSSLQRSTTLAANIVILVERRAMQQAIFISYRREDSPDAVGRVYDRLKTAFGEANVFKDVDELPPGRDFEDDIVKLIPRCGIVLALIGPHWASGGTGAPSDWVRIELECALREPSVEVIPVLVGGASLPSTEQLPEALHPLLRLNFATVRRDPDFHRDMDRLITTMSVLGVPQAANGPSPTSLWSELSRKEDADEIRRFVETFPGSAEAFEARRRIDQLATLRRIRLVAARVEQEREDDWESAWLLIRGIYCFRNWWKGTAWDEELSMILEFAEQFVDPHEYQRYEEVELQDKDLLDSPSEWAARVDLLVAGPAALRSSEFVSAFRQLDEPDQQKTLAFIESLRKAPKT